MATKDIEWIDVAKGYCMVSVYLIHSVYYSGIEEETFCYILYPFYVNAFFFISGYLLFLKQYHHSKPFNTIKNLSNILYRLVIPTIIFSSFTFIPKILFHHDVFSVHSYFINVFGGISFWFTSALASAQLLLIILILICKNKLSIILFLSFLLFLIGIAFNNNRQDAEAINYLPWYLRTGMVYVLIMVLGGIYSIYEKNIDSFIKYCLPLIFIIYAISMLVYRRGTPMLALGMGGQCNLFGLMCMFMGIIIIICVSKKLPSLTFIKYIGRNSITFYFLSSVYPALIGTIIKRLNISIISTIAFFAVFVLALLIGFVTTWFIKKYCMFLIDIRKAL